MDKTEAILLALLAGVSILPIESPGAALPYTIVSTGQIACYDNRKQIEPPRAGRPFFGQDAQFNSRSPAASYTLSADGLTVRDQVTGLTWQRSADRDGNGILNAADKLAFAQAQALPAKLNTARFGGFNDWRLPTIKELYSLIQFSGVDASGPDPMGSQSQRPFLDTRFFKFAYGDTGAGERTIDSQWATSTVYVANPNQMFGVNFADGRIKGYGTTMPGGREKKFFVICVRGNPAYGINDFHDNGNGTVTDRATGLMWQQADSGKAMNWEQALAYAAVFKLAGYSDWRLPNAKELQSIVDYTRAPAVTNSAAINPVFHVTKTGDGDYPYFWTSTTHVGGPPDQQGGAAVYIAFGRAMGWMQPHGGPPGAPAGPDQGRPSGMEPPPGGSGPYQLVDVHGAGAQRSDPKAGDPAAFPHGRGPQGDVIRIYNYVRLVRGGSSQ